MTHPTRWYSNKQEKAVAKNIKGHQVVNSGATDFAKGDVVTADWLIECKTVMKEQKSFSIKKEWLCKNKEEAFAMDKNYNALCFDFGDNTRYYILDEPTFLKLKELADETDN